jgi:precorrin-2 dehydrogenase / sirohydrochlorin ferrochelatase
MRGLPVNLLAAGRHCLVAGGGRVALRKIHSLLDGGARVKVVSPQACAEVAELVAQKKVTHIARCVEAEDVQDCFLAFAATNDVAVNRQVLTNCKKKGILCCCVDENWPDGEFVTPAVLRRGDITVAVSTGGRSCRRARMIKRSLDRHIQSLVTADLLIMGTRHERLSAAERENYRLTGREMERIGGMLSQITGIHEFMLLTARNRLEVVAIVSDQSRINDILKRILRFDRLGEDRFYFKRGLEAFEHLSLVTSGLLSQSPGACRVASQVKKALEYANRRGWTNGVMKEWVSSSLRLSQRIQNEARRTNRDGLKRRHRQPPGSAGRIFDISRKIILEHKDLYESLLQSFQGWNATE